MKAEAESDDGERTPLLEHRAAWAALLAIAVVVAFGSAIDGELVWDDAAMVGAAAALPSPWAAFSRDFFALGARAAEGAGASWFRPLVTLSYALDLRLFSAAPAFGLHLVGLFWHVLASVLAVGALLRWTRAASSQGKIACFIAALFWAVLPAKAENVAWISGRGDAMGLALLFAGLALRAEEMRSAGRMWVRAAAVASATVLALLCKESFVVAPALVAIEIASEGGEEGARARWSRVIRAPETIASAAVVVAYLALRRAYLPIHGGGEAMFAGLSIGDRAALVIETLGHAAQAIVICFEAHLLRGPIGFTAPFVLKRDPGMLIFGAAFVVLVATLAWRAPRLRLAALLLAGALLPVSNVIPSGLESRFSDRFLYVPSLGIALATAVLLTAAPVKAFRAVALGLAAGAVGLMLVSAARSTKFRSSTSLWEHERRYGHRAPTVLHNAAMAALRERRYPDARDRLIETATRYGELGFDEGYPYLVRAVEAEVRATGEHTRGSLEAYRRLLEALASGAPGTVRVPFENGRSLRVPTGTADARAYAAARDREIRLKLALLDARAGDEGRGAAAQAEVDACPRCRPVLREAARVALAIADPDRAREWLSRLGPDEEADGDRLAESATIQAELLRRGGDLAKAQALFLGEAYVPACRTGEAALGGARDAPAAARTTIAVACHLAGDFGRWESVRRGLDPAVARDIESFGTSYRTEPGKRLELFGVAR